MRMKLSHAYPARESASKGKGEPGRSVPRRNISGISGICGDLGRRRGARAYEANFEWRPTGDTRDPFGAASV